MSMSSKRTTDSNLSSSFHGNTRQMTQNFQHSGSCIRRLARRWPNILTDLQITRLKEHKYASEGTTLLDPYMQIFWKWLVEYCPLWVAPNLITIVGLAVNIGASIFLMILTDGAKEQCTRWMYFLTGLGTFIYQSLDAIDGKQARRTDSSTPLGELFDHGCDSVSTAFVTIAFCCTIQLGVYPWLMFWCCMFSYIIFYCAHWQTYVTGKLRFASFDCTEAQFFFLFICMVTAIWPPVWTKSIPIIHIELRVLAALAMIISGLCNAMNNIHTISKGGCGRHYSTIAVAHMSKSSLYAWDSAYYGPIAFCVNQYFGCYISEHKFLWFFLIYSLGDLLRYNIKVCQELCDALGIHCFRIKPPTMVKSDMSH
ncbi:unnamed protein product [Adineta ricciae]|uniref:diacylglycerol cholinephosphotransferase n=1 Tax=Adineta ricciae TaxID=249248 RepID=A0A814K7P3_ADIRI|nr:unnamed protein product [Adineta ricciae]CAF1320873.1 unnamed protein product [Adineta ricciae]